MRALAILLVSLITSCSLAVDTSELSGGTRAAVTDSAPAADAATDTGTCVPEECAADLKTVSLADIAPCSAATTDKLGCRAKVAERCRALDPCCFHGGYGPVELPNATTATIICFIDDTYEAPVSEVTSANPKCLASALASRECDIAAHTSAKKRGHGTGIVQKVDGANATLLGVDNASVDMQTTPWSELTKLDAGCTLANIDTLACTRAVQRFCTTGVDNEGNVGGYGPVAYDASDATVVCIW
jgi:hypothetical protein